MEKILYRGSHERGIGGGHGTGVGLCTTLWERNYHLFTKTLEEVPMEESSPCTALWERNYLLFTKSFDVHTYFQSNLHHPFHPSSLSAIQSTHHLHCPSHPSSLFLNPYIPYTMNLYLKGIYCNFWYLGYSDTKCFPPETM
jgi:hypothetical protein